MVNLENYMQKEYMTKEDIQKNKTWIIISVDFDKDNKPVATLLHDTTKKKLTLAKDVCKQIDEVYEGFGKQTEIAVGKKLVFDIYPELNKKTGIVMNRIKININASKLKKVDRSSYSENFDDVI